MYANYFGLKEPSFTITPDPQYLFLSEQHREALAHLVYGAGESGGFVLLTGEVGTGKTTVCRAFLEQLPEHVDVALILNPAMTVTELLRAVCDEFRIPLADEERTVKSLVDRLNQYLLEAHARGRRPVLMIDESQNLRPKVLEQIRLLTNLETPKHKLLQIFLIGQPELRTILEREGLRQLNQRITARYHLLPLSLAETSDYVRHRLAVAGVDRPLFTRSALRRLHRISGGVPRLVNILCDRALLGACVTRSPSVTRSILDEAAREVQVGASAGRARPRAARPSLVALLALTLVAGAAWWTLDRQPGGGLEQIRTFAGGWLPGPSGLEPVQEPVPEPAVGAGEAVEDRPRAALAETAPEPPVEPELDASTLIMDQTSAMRLLLRRWGVELGTSGGRDPCLRVASFGLRCEDDEGGWSRLRDFDRPALLRLKDLEGNEGFAPLGVLGTERATLDLPGGESRVSLADLDPLWLGDYVLVWQPPPVGTTVIGPGSSRQAVRWLRKLLSQVAESGIADSGSGAYDRELEDAVRRFQVSAGLEADGIAGPRTLIRLHNAVGMPGPPRLRQET